MYFNVLYSCLCLNNITTFLLRIQRFSFQTSHFDENLYTHCAQRRVDRMQTYAINFGRRTRFLITSVTKFALPLQVIIVTSRYMVI